MGKEFFTPKREDPKERPVFRLCAEIFKFGIRLELERGDKPLSTDLDFRNDNVRFRVGTKNVKDFLIKELGELNDYLKERKMRKGASL